MDPHPLRLLETAPPLRSSTLSANPANSRFRVRQDHRLASSEVVNKISSKTLTDQLRSLVLVVVLGLQLPMQCENPTLQSRDVGLAESGFALPADHIFVGKSGMVRYRSKRQS